MTAAKPLPTPEQLKAYADQLPSIYRDVLSAFATAEPERHYGDDLSLETIVAHVLNRNRTAQGHGTYGVAELGAAVGKLFEAELLDKHEGDPYFFPTPVGEELVAVLTGRRAPKLVVPDLPKPTW